MPDAIRLAHGFGGMFSQKLIDEIIHPALSGASGHPVTLDAAVLEDLEPPVVVSTDSYTIAPRFFPGGDIGKLAVAGTVNDITMMGAHPRYLTLGLILEEGLPMDDLRLIMTSVGDTCRATGIEVVTGDTKVVGRGAVDGIFINTCGFGTRVTGPLGPHRISDGDHIIITGTIGDHGAAILNAREELGFTIELLSDCAPLNGMLNGVFKLPGDLLHALRDPTRGGIAATLNEFAADTGLELVISERSIPIRPEVASFLEVLGMDVLTLANEGKALLFAAPEATGDILAVLHAHEYGRGATVIGQVNAGTGRGRVVLETAIGTRRIIDMPVEAGLPRIC